MPYLDSMLYHTTSSWCWADADRRREASDVEDLPLVLGRAKHVRFSEDGSLVGRGGRPAAR